ncbi:MAG TPA: arginine deiminase family protein [Ktedonobacterales bacterium]|nr:arginine deiminase family protein [Ktedonobacterales bacterium]
MARTYGNQSMVAPLKRVLVKPPAETAEDTQRWQEFGYHFSPDVEETRRQHDGLVKLLRDTGAEVVIAEESQPALLDSIFVTDPGFVTDAGAIIGHMGKQLRRGEEPALARELTRLGIPILGTLEGDETLEGGDVLWLDPETLVIGRSYRTNDAGYQRVRELLAGRVKHIHQVQMAHWHGRDEILHLLSVISPVAEDLALVYLPLVPVPLYELLEARGIRTIEVPDSEFATHAPNALAVAPGHVITMKGNPITAGRLRDAGVTVWEYEGRELTLNRDGGATCMTCCLLRDY